MSFLDDVVNDIKDQITAVGLSIGGSEVSGGGYAALDPGYGTSTGGAGQVDLAATLQFSGPANTGPVDEFIFKRAGGDWVTRPVDTPASFNSDGRIDVTSLPVTEDFAG